MGTESPIRDVMIEIVSHELASFEVIQSAGELIAADASFSSRMASMQGRSVENVYLEGLRLYHEQVDVARKAWETFQRAAARVEAQGVLAGALVRIKVSLDSFPKASMIEIQKAVCQKYGTQWFDAPDHFKVGIARNVLTGLKPLNGLRHPPEGCASGWYIWAGEELSQADDFFVPLHVSHIAEWCPAALKYLGLPPGWRFLTDGSYEDVWEDASLFDI